MESEERLVRGKSSEARDDNDRLSRFIRSRKDFAAQKGRAKRNAFMPSGNPLQLSVFVTQDLNETEVWALTSHLQDKVRARADFTNDFLTRQALTLDRDDDPPRHANVVGWPSEKEHQMSIALEFEIAAHLVVAPLDS